MSTSNIIVKKSAISGRGLFSTRNVRKGQVLFTVEGPLIKYKFPKEPNWWLGPHWLNVGKNQWVIPNPDNVWRFVNHSCNPNATIVSRQRVVAVRPIGFDEEIKIDYALAECHLPWRMACTCKENTCRGIIRSVQFLPEPLYRKYQPYIRPYMKREYLLHKTDTQEEGNRIVVTAKRPLRRGEVIFRVEGPTILYKRSPNYRRGYRWLSVGMNMWIIPESDNQWNFLQHSCRPNVGLNDKQEVVALRRILSDEILTIDDSITENDPRWHMNCHCGSDICRQVVGPIQSLPKDVYQRYLPYIPTFLQRIYVGQT